MSISRHGHYNAGQSFRSSGDTTLKHFDGDSSKLNNAELPSRPEPPKTPFMCFARYKEEEMARNRQTGDIKSSDKVRQIAEEWKSITSKERAHWNEMARQDKIRYDAQRTNYTGWAIPRRRAKKHPLAPKRPMSAFLRFSKTRRSIVKMQNPDMSNTDVSRLLGEMWHNAPASERNPYIEEEIQERKIYKTDIAKWKAEHSNHGQTKNSPDSVAAEDFNLQPKSGATNNSYPHGSIHPRYDFTPEYAVDGWEPYGYCNAAHQRGPAGYQRNEEHEHYNKEDMMKRSSNPTNCHASFPAILRHDAAPASIPNYAEHPRLHSISPPRLGNDVVYYYQGRHHPANEGISYKTSDSSSSRFPRPFMS